MNTLQVAYTVIGGLLLVLCALITGHNLYALQPITLLRHGSKGLKKRSSPGMLIGDMLAFGATVFLCLGQATQSGRNMAVLVVLPVWLLNPVALPWFMMAAIIYLTRQLIRGPDRWEVLMNLAALVLVVYVFVATALALLGIWSDPWAGRNRWLRSLQWPK